MVAKAPIRQSEKGKKGCLPDQSDQIRKKTTDCVAKIVACYETWCQHFDPAYKRMSMEWLHPSVLVHKKSILSRKSEKECLVSFSTKDDFYLSNGYNRLEQLILS